MSRVLIARKLEIRLMNRSLDFGVGLVEVATLGTGFHYVHNTCLRYLHLSCSYQLFNTLALFPVEFYESGAVPDVLMNALFADAKYISLHHWRSLLQTTMIPFVLHCPSQLYVSVLGSVLPALTMHLNEQLAAAWTPENLVKFSTQA